MDKRRRYHTEPRALLREDGLLANLLAFAGMCAAFAGLALLLVGVA